MFDLTGRKALVTGATGGIGEAVARMLHQAGATVGLHGTRVEKLEALAADLGERTKMFPANLSDRDEVKALGQRPRANSGRPTSWSPIARHHPRRPSREALSAIDLDARARGQSDLGLSG